MSVDAAMRSMKEPAAVPSGDRGRCAPRATLGASAPLRLSPTTPVPGTAPGDHSHRAPGSRPLATRPGGRGV
jgi:hypothetical protein